MLQKSPNKCAKCESLLCVEVQYAKAVDLLFFSIGDANIAIDMMVKACGWKQAKNLRLRGVIYTDKSHYTTRIIDSRGGVWVQDGMSGLGECQSEGKLSDFVPKTIGLWGLAKAVVVIYAKVARV